MSADEQRQLREDLLQEYERIRTKNARYSQRAYAAYLGLSSGELSEILSGKRKISRRKLNALKTKLNTIKDKGN